MHKYQLGLVFMGLTLIAGSIDTFFWPRLYGTTHVETSQPVYKSSKNLREKCREQMAGFHLQLLDNENSQLFKITHLEATLKDLAPMIKKALDLKNSLQTIHDPYDAKEDEARNLAKSRAAELENDRKNLINELNQEKTALAIVQKRRGLWEKAVSGVFVVVKIKPRDNKASPDAYPYRVFYERSCPTYNDNCPLDKKEIQILKKIPSHFELPLECKTFVTESLK